MSDVDSKDCTRCGLNLPLTEFAFRRRGESLRRSRCKACEVDSARAYQAQYREAHREQFKEYKREWYLKNRDRTLGGQREDYAQNPEKYAARASRYYQRNKDRIARGRKADPEKYREIRRLTRLRNRDTRRHYDHTRRNHIGPDGSKVLTQEKVDARVAYFGWKCWMCGGPYEHIDHVKPISKGGTSLPANLRPACANCNIRKKAKWPFTIEDVTWLFPQSVPVGL